ncbi:hypothetical protein Cfor_10694 [Coptotermes formosanus]|uniref:Uncharacterized protein n=1 Tax=Coptotermes formosanus TaxID=36987 RepID=A0A6L2PNS7_COPFO|nr:hypothetical protein Cfor_10694 [Coptotermes formosanus]
MLITVKYDFIALKKLEFQKVSLDLVDTLIIGDLVYPSGSLVPRLNGLTSGVVTVIKGCLLRPLQERWTQNKLDKDFCASAFDFVSFEPRSRNVRGLRAMWNKGKPLPFTKKWNPFSNDIPWTTYMSHPLSWRKGFVEWNLNSRHALRVQFPFDFFVSSFTSFDHWS